MLGEMIQLCLLTSFWTVSCQLPPSSWRRLQGNLTWFFYGNFKLDLTFFTAFSKKKQEHAFWPCISPPLRFFGLNFWFSANGRDIFPNEVCEVRRAHRTLSVLLFVPHALLCRQGGERWMVEWWTSSPQTTPGWNTGVSAEQKRNGIVFVHTRNREDEDEFARREDVRRYDKEQESFDFLNGLLASIFYWN